MLLKETVFLFLLHLFFMDVVNMRVCSNRRRRYVDSNCCPADAYDGDYGYQCNSLCLRCSNGFRCVNGRCICPTTQIYFSGNCIIAKDYGTACTASGECKDTLTCDGTCKCLSHEYFDRTCKNKPSIDGSCATTIPCRNNLVCTNSRCVCTATQYFDTDFVCKAKSSYGGQCSTTILCLNDLTCINNRCNCTTNQFLDNGNLCKSTKPYGTVCMSTRECQSSLTCDGTCTCTSSEYFDGTCKTRSSYGGPCSATILCLDDLMCINNRCNCTINQFLDLDNLCKATKPHGTVCMSTRECQSSLTCEGTCTCTSSEYFDGTCKTRVNLKGNCFADSQCAKNLTCIGGRCNCR
ncbi:unnamed protein product, partial [Lymnaea stagnalis]